MHVWLLTGFSCVHVFRHRLDCSAQQIAFSKTNAMTCSSSSRPLSVPTKGSKPQSSGTRAHQEPEFLSPREEKCVRAVAPVQYLPSCKNLTETQTDWSCEKTKENFHTLAPCILCKTEATTVKASNHSDQASFVQKKSKLKREVRLGLGAYLVSLSRMEMMSVTRCWLSVLRLKRRSCDTSAMTVSLMPRVSSDKIVWRVVAVGSGHELSVLKIRFVFLRSNRVLVFKGLQWETGKFLGCARGCVKALLRSKQQNAPETWRPCPPVESRM